METVYIIGSGPSGVACALGLLARNNVQVVMLDVGKKLETGKLENRLKNNLPILYPNDDLPWEDKKKVKLFNKHLFGSIYPYDIGHYAEDFDLNEVMLRASVAQGGLSNVWGASIMPYRTNELDHWPISADEINFYYKTILEHLPFSTCFQNDFVDWPLLHEEPTEYMTSHQARYLWQRYLGSRKKLNSDGIIAGGARLAIYQKNHLNQSGCTYCSECMYGCVSDSIYSARHTLSELKKNPLFQYRIGIHVNKITEKNKSVIIDAYDIHNKMPVLFHAHRVFVAMGVLMSAKLLMNSFYSIRNAEIKIQDSQHFLLPCLMFHRIKKLRNKSSHSMSQLFYEILDSNYFKESVHLQLYTYIDLYEHEFENKIKFLKKIKKYLNPFYERLVVFQGFLPSTFSGKISVCFDAEKQKIMVNGQRNPDTIFYIKKIMKLLFRHSHRLGFVPLIPFYKMSQIGISNHYGASFPMKKYPEQPLESNCLGIPKGLERVHMVDASVLPSIQAQSVTLTSMANAYRIGNICSLES
jgi:hypothetical protein